MSMTPDEQQSALLDWMGFKFIPSHDVQRPGPDMMITLAVPDSWRDPDGCLADCENNPLPNYPTNLNAMHEVEIKIVENGLGYSYSHNLYNVVVPKAKQPFMADADERCEAACRVLFPERWQEGGLK